MQVDDEMLTRAERDTNLCRVCLTVDYNNQCIFRRDMNDPNGAGISELPEKLQLCGGVEVLEDDGLPAGICVKCLMKVNVAYELREQCQKADVELRKLYGIALKKSIGNSVSTRDQYCQTEQIFSLDAIKLEDGVEVSADGGSSARKSVTNTTDSGTPDVFNENNHTGDILIDNELDVSCTKYRSKQVEQGKVTKKEAYRTRRLTVFKRVTSMENLRNYKEMQRRYIKKSANVKCDINDSEHQTKPKIIHSGVDDVSELTDLLLSEFESRYKCSTCDKCYSSKKSLDRHASTHNKELKCDNCDKQFLCLDKLLKHKASVHKAKEKPQPAVCSICNKSFRKTDTMVRHLNVHKRANPKEVFSILKEMRDRRKLENSRECSEVLHVAADVDEGMTLEEKSQGENDGATRELRRRVIKAEQRDSDLGNSDTSSDKFDSFDDTALFQCKHCSKSYSTERSLQRHTLVHDEKKFVCNFCNMKFYRQDRLKSHMDRYGHDVTKASTEPQKPPDDKSAIKLINSWIREELDSDNEGKGFPCETCGKSYDTKKSLRKHQVNAHSGRNGYCANCDGVCTCADAGGRTKEQPEKSAEKSKPYTCEECNKSFEKEVKLQRHLRIHERAKEQQDANFKRFLCHICSKTFRQNTGLMFHMRTHTGYKPHVCKYCGRGFTSNSNCINHERTHTGDRPFVCQYCSAAFAKSCTLKAHITTHTGEANYHCKTCGKSFRRLKYLKEHRFTHTGEKPYACKLCGTAYSHSGSLFVHEKKCKAQYSNYQPAVAAAAAAAAAAATTQNHVQTPYGQSPQSVGGVGGISAASPSSVITPIITTLPQAHLNVINSTLNVQNKNYMDNVQRMNVHTAATTVVSPGLHANADIPEMSPAVSYVGRYEQKANQDSTVIKISFF